MRARFLPLVRLVVLAAVAGRAPAQDWPQWRGPAHDGSTTVTGLPAKFDKDTNVRWAVDLPGPGASTPVILAERVFVTSIDRAAQALLAMCFERATGEERWVRSAGSDYRPAGDGTGVELDDRSNYASPSPVTDGERVVFFFGSGDLVAYDLEGEKLWARNLQKDYGDFAFQWTFSSSPTLWQGRLFVQVLQRDEPVEGRGKEGSSSFLLAIDPRSGETLFRHERPSQAQKESLESYATPLPYVGKGGRKELLLVGGDVITGHDPESGAELWRWGTWNPGHREMWWRLVPSVVVGGGVALVCAPKRAPVFAVKLDGEGELGPEGLAWQSSGRANPVSSDVPTPLFYQDRFFVLSDVREALSRVHPKSGEVEWTVSMPGRHRWRASPTGADGRLWCMNHHGDVVVIDPEDGKVLHQAAMGGEDDDQIRSTVAIAHGALFLRTNEKLFCVAK